MEEASQPVTLDGEIRKQPPPSRRSSSNCERLNGDSSSGRDGWGDPENKPPPGLTAAPRDRYRYSPTACPVWELSCLFKCLQRGGKSNNLTDSSRAFNRTRKLISSSGQFDHS